LWGVARVPRTPWGTFIKQALMYAIPACPT
jgi:hypothetical protein